MYLQKNDEVYGKQNQTIFKGLLYIREYDLVLIASCVIPQRPGASKNAQFCQAFWLLLCIGS